MSNSKTGRFAPAPGDSETEASAAGLDAVETGAEDLIQEGASEFERLLAGFRAKMVNVRAHLDHATRGDIRACALGLSALADLVERLFDHEKRAG